MKYLMVFVFVLLSFPVFAHEEDEPISNTSELRSWCKSESEAHYVAQGITAYNWSASYWDKGNILYVQGNWRINSDDVVVECRIARGAKTKYAVFEIKDKLGNIIFKSY